MPKLLYILTALFLSHIAYGQDNDRFVNYGVNEGLSQSSIDDIIQDKDGFLWAGTASGLCRFDGYRFNIYKPSSHDSFAIPSDRGFHFYNDRDGRLWIISFNGISVYNSLTDNFTNVLVYEPQHVITIENHFFGEDEQFIWAGFCNYGIVKIDKQTKRIYPVRMISDRSRPTVNAWYHGFIEKGKLWCIDNNEFNRQVAFTYDLQTKKIDSFHLPVADIINMNDTEMIGLAPKGIMLINKKDLSSQLISITTDGSEPNILNAYCRSGNEALLCSTTKGLFYLDTRLRKITKRIIVTDPENKRSFLYARCAYTDHSGNLWIGTRGDGLQKLAYPYKRFKWYHADSGSNNNVFSIYADNEQVYIGGLGHGFNIFSRQKGFIKNVVVNRNLPSIVNNAYTLTGFRKDKLLVIGNNSKSNKNNIPFTYTKSTGRIALLDAGVQKLFADNWGRGNLRHFLFKDSDSVFLTNIGEYLVSLTACSAERFCTAILNQFPGETLSFCFSDARGELWLATYSGAYHRQKNEWKKIALPKNIEIKTINQDPAGNIWLGTPNEIFVLDDKEKVAHHYTEENGLVNGHLYGILRDDDGNMWFSHNKGLSVYRWKEKKFDHYGKEDGLQSSEFNAGAYFKAADGELFFGGINGVTAFYPREVLRNPNTPRVQITGIKLFDDPLKSDTAYWNIRKLVLPYTDNTISFEYALPEFTNPAKNQYRYIMEGVDNSWINAGDKRFTRYPGLSPGHYLFKLQAANNDGVYGKEPTTIAITIVPPFWQSVWFITLSILLFIILSIGIGIFIQKLRQQKQVRAWELQQKLQQERERISRDLHDNVGTQLSLISKNIEGVISPLHPVPESERIHNLSMISQTSKEVIFTLRETIWALNKEEISIEELSDKLKAFTQKLFGINHACGLSYSEEIEDGDKLMLSPSEAIHLFRICQEAIANSLKYANASHMEISISLQKGKYRISISDDGIGFDPGKTEATVHYGLVNMRFRAEEINCLFTIDTIPGKGTRIIISKK
jgi:signal transduction histidine kinase/ligand-binding sensor domain-containing protein